MNHGYIIKPIPGKVEPRFFVSIKADSNDADYLTESSNYTMEEFENGALRALQSLIQTGSRRGDLEEWCHNNPELKEELPIPFTEWGVCHSIENIVVTYRDQSGGVHDVDILPNPDFDIVELDENGDEI